ETNTAKTPLRITFIWLHTEVGKKRSGILHAAWILWICFLVRGLFYCAALPLWEGFDEFAHFAYVQRVAEGAHFVDAGARPSREVERSVELVPMPWTVRNDPPPNDTYESYWARPAEERAARQEALRSMPRELRSREATSSLPIEWPQPPLAYWVMTWI